MIYIEIQNFIKESVKQLIIKDLSEDKIAISEIKRDLEFSIDDQYEVTGCSTPSFENMKYFDTLFKKNNIEYIGTESFCTLYQRHIDMVQTKVLGE